MAVEEVLDDTAEIFKARGILENISDILLANPSSQVGQAEVLYGYTIEKSLAVLPRDESDVFARKFRAAGYGLIFEYEPKD
jgi:hypothetical protein